MMETMSLILKISSSNLIVQSNYNKNKIFHAIAIIRQKVIEGIAKENSATASTIFKRFDEKT